MHIQTIEEMTVEELYEAAEYEKFSVTNLLHRATQVATGEEYNDLVKYINSFELSPRSGSWYKSPPTVTQ